MNIIRIPSDSTGDLTFIVAATVETILFLKKRKSDISKKNAVPEEIITF